LSLVIAGCGVRAAGSLELPQQPSDKTPSVPRGDVPASASLAEFIAKARALAAEARPPARAALAHAEAIYPRLAAALAAASARPSPETLRQVAEEYRRLRIADRAHHYLQQALRLDPHDAATYDALARLWRDGGLSGLALADAHRAVYYAPASAIAHNTLGTVFQALGRRKEARTQYERAVQLDPSAAYALNNLCYGWILDHQPGRAVAACEAALTLAPGLAAGRNNLGLAYAARGELDAARGAFDGVGDRATALYNIGIVYMAKRQYRDAVSAFIAAQRARPSLHMAAARAEQAGKLALAGAGE
jgi:Flp pilus assembly protein TadD